MSAKKFGYIFFISKVAYITETICNKKYHVGNDSCGEVYLENKNKEVKIFHR